MSRFRPSWRLDRLLDLGAEKLVAELCARLRDLERRCVSRAFRRLPPGRLERRATTLRRLLEGSGGPVPRLPRVLRRPR